MSKSKPMFPPMDLCHQIGRIYPEVGECGIEVSVTYDKKKGAWVVGLDHEDTHLETHLEEEDARSCMEGGRCVNLSVKIGQLKDNLDRLAAE